MTNPKDPTWEEHKNADDKSLLKNLCGIRQDMQIFTCHIQYRRVL